MIDPNEPHEQQIARQAKIIDALVRRASRQEDVGPSAFRAFQSAIDLQEQVAAQSRDLERATTELESARYERERSRKSLVEALSSMEEGFALFSSGRLDLCNDLFRNLLPDVAERVVTGLRVEQYFDLLSESNHLVSTDRHLGLVATALKDPRKEAAIVSMVVELRNDRWYQMSAQYASSENLVLLLTEITAILRRNRREKENLIDKQADYLQAVFQNMGSGVCTFSASDEVMMQNARFREILGIPLTILEPGMPLQRVLEFMVKRDLIRPGDGDLVEKWRHVLTSKGRFHRRVRHGADRVMDIHANMLPDGGYLVELKDVTLEARATEMLENRVMERTAELTRANAKLVAEYEEKARVEEELRLAKERAEAAVSSKTRFLAAASHDLLQPINAAKLLISTLMETTRETEFHGMMERLEGAFGSAEHLLHSLLDISRLESPDPDAVSPSNLNLAPLMGGIFADQVLVAEEKNVKLSVIPCSVFVHSDPIYLLRSVQNLVVNAIQYTNPGGRVLVGCRRAQGKVRLEVWDTGIGIALKDQARIFEEFARAGDVPIGSGVGLGLSVVDRACRLLGHKLSVRSKPGVGSVFGIELEQVEGVQERAEPQGLMHLTEDLSLEHIVLVIENDRDVLYGTTQWLEQWGASVLPASSTEEALSFVHDIGLPPDIILADYHLDHGATGVEAIARIREASECHVPAILITADRSRELRQAGIQNDISVMTKPVKLSQLRPLIDWKIRWNTVVQGEDRMRTLNIPTKVGGDTIA